VTRALKYFDLVLRLALGGLFLVAAAGKILDPVKFLGGISQYGLVSGWLLPFSAAAMPGVEVVSGLGLIFGWKVRANALLISGLLVLFMAAMGSAMARGLELDCSCFDLLGTGAATVGWGTQLRDLALLIPALWLAFRDVK
jgi:putative oxidoreductase